MRMIFDDVAAAVRVAALDRGTTIDQDRLLASLGFAEVVAATARLTARGEAFDEAWNVYRQKDLARGFVRDRLLELQATQALIQGLHGRGEVRLVGALHLLAKLRLADPDDPDSFSELLLTLDEFGIVYFSKGNQTVRVIAEMPIRTGEEAKGPELKIVTPDRPYQNIRHLRETLRACRGYIWWADPHFDKQAFEPLEDEADATKIAEIKILSSGRPEQAAANDYRRFSEEMLTLGITVEWRSVRPPDRDWHDRFIITRGKVWNVPPAGAIFKGRYSEFKATEITPPFEEWWINGTPI
jgi:hypothetical protein